MGTLYDWAAAAPGRHEYQGRGPVYAVAAGGERIVVRRVRHGGMLAPITGDLFTGSTRAPHELDVSLRLLAGGVRTPAVLAYAVYPAGVAGLLRRVDVVTREISSGLDLARAIQAGPESTERIWGAVTELLASLTRVGAVHPDLNARNIIIAGSGADTPVAWVIDVDRIHFARPGDPSVAAANRRRLERSAAKLGLQ